MMDGCCNKGSVSFTLPGSGELDFGAIITFNRNTNCFMRIDTEKSDAGWLSSRKRMRGLLYISNVIRTSGPRHRYAVGSQMGASSDVRLHHKPRRDNSRRIR